MLGSTEFPKSDESFLPVEVVEEINGFLWAKPVVDRGVLDLGWSCREHASVVGGLVLLSGRTPFFASGTVMFVQGGTDRYAPCGIGGESGIGVNHSWLVVEDYGNIDISVNLVDGPPGWRTVEGSTGFQGDSWRIKGLAATTFVSKSPQEFDQCIAQFSHLRDKCAVAYLLRSFNPLDLGFLRNPISSTWASPRTPEVVRLAGQLAYVKLIVHIRGLLGGKGKRIGHLSNSKSWKVLDVEVTDVEAMALLEELKLMARATAEVPGEGK